MRIPLRSTLAAGLSALLLAPGPAVAAQVASVVPQGDAQAVSGGTFGLGGGRVGPGPSAQTSLDSLAGSLKLGLTPSAMSVRASASAAVSATPLAISPSAVAAKAATPAPASAELEAARGVLACAAPTGASQKASDLAASKSSWDAYWSGSLYAPSDADSALAAAPSGPAGAPLAAAQPQADAKRAVPCPAPGPAVKAGSWRKAMLAQAGLAAAWLAVRLGLPAWLPSLSAKAEPYVAGGGILVTAYVLCGLARRAIGASAKRWDWRPGTTLAVRLGSSLTIYGVGGALGLHAMGVSTSALLTTFGMGGVAMTMAAKDFISNFLEGIKILLNRPFVIGDRIKIGAQEYKVQDMDLRYISLAKPEGGVTMMTYSQLADSPVTIFRQYSTQGFAAASELKSLWRGVNGLLRATPRPSLLKTSLWTVLGVGLVAAVPLLPVLVGSHLLLGAAAGWSWLPYAKGALSLLAGHFLKKGALGFLRRTAEARGWRPQTAAVAKIGLELGIWLLSGTAALRFFGMTWSALLKSLGATSFAVGWASGDIIGNLIQGFWILTSHPFTVGDELDVGGVTGVVVDMNLTYVVLQHKDKTHTLVPYAVLKGSPFTVLSRSVK